VTVHYGVEVGTDEEGETYWLVGHIPDRRAIATSNRYARVECGLRDLYDGARWSDGPIITRLWLRPDPVRSCYGCGRPAAECRAMGGESPGRYCCDEESCSHPAADEWLIPCAETDPGAQPWTRLDP
jgi:hypothetical protein